MPGPPPMDYDLISIHAPREGGDPARKAFSADLEISIHAPREGGDCVDGRVFRHGNNFNPRPPRGGRRAVWLHCRDAFYFNPRPPRGGRPRAIGTLTCWLIFQSTPPARGATYEDMYFFDMILFQSTPPARGATTAGRMACASAAISIHAPREGGDFPSGAQIVFGSIFQSTPPARGATSRRRRCGIRRTDFNPRPPRGGRPGGACIRGLKR